MKTFTFLFKKPVLVVLLLINSMNLIAQQQGLQSDKTSTTKGSILAPIITFVVPATDPTKMSVSWIDPNPFGTVSQYFIYRVVGTGVPTFVANRFSQVYIDDDVQPGFIYTYVITAIGTNGQESPRSAPASGSIPFPLVAPTNLVATANNNTGVVTLNWEDSNVNETGFEIDRKVNNGSFALYKDLSITGDNLTDIDTQITLGNTYSYRVRAKEMQEDLLIQILLL